MAGSKPSKNRRPGNTAAAVWKLAQPIAEGLGLTVWDVRFVKEGALWYLRIFIDKPEGVGIEDCEAMSRAVNGPLDQLDPIEQSYYLEVGSPGLGRRLTKPEHYDALTGQKIRVRLYRANAAGQREFAGILTGREGSTVTVETEAGPASFELQAASMVRLCDDEDLFG